MNYDVLSSDVVYDGKILQLVVDKIRYRSSGRESAREVVVKDGQCSLKHKCLAL